jgi:hypothetical protein
MQRPALRSCSFHQSGAVNDRTAESIHLRNKQAASLARPNGRERGLCAMPASQTLCADALVAIRIDDRQSLTFGITGCRRPLSLDTEARECLL